MKASRKQVSFASREAAMETDEKEPLTVNKEAVRVFKVALNKHFKSTRMQMVKANDFWSVLTEKPQFSGMTRTKSLFKGKRFTECDISLLFNYQIFNVFVGN